MMRDLLFLAVFALAVLVLAHAKDWWLAARKAKDLTRDPALFADVNTEARRVQEWCLAVRKAKDLARDPALFADMNAEARRQRLQVTQAPAAPGLTSERKKVTHG